jgi:LmbE family N-acetylglucosaminyl deacetylase
MSAAARPIAPRDPSRLRDMRTRLLLARLRPSYAGIRIADPWRAMPPLRGIRALVIAPHPDDEVIGCGGLIRRLVESGSRVGVLFLTREGDRSLVKPSQVEGRDRRTEESLAAQQVLGYQDRRELSFPERGLSSEGERFVALREAIFREVAAAHPDLLVVPNTHDFHPDHAAAGAAALDAWRSVPKVKPTGTVLLYEVWGPCDANVGLPLETALVQRKIAALTCYASQLESADYQSVMAFVHTRRAEMAPCGMPAADWLEAYRIAGVAPADGHVVEEGRPEEAMRDSRLPSASRVEVAEA